MEKDPRLVSLVEFLRVTLGDELFQVVDHWPGDLSSIGLASRDDEMRLAYISVFKKNMGRCYFECEQAKGVLRDELEVVDRGDDVTYEELATRLCRHLRPTQ